MRARWTIPWIIAMSFTRVAALRSTVVIHDSIIEGVTDSTATEPKVGRICEPSSERYVATVNGFRRRSNSM